MTTDDNWVEREELVPSLAIVAGRLGGGSKFVKGQLERLEKESSTRRFGPSKADFKEMIFLVDTLADLTDDLATAIAKYSAYEGQQSKNGVVPHKWIKVYDYVGK